MKKYFVDFALGSIAFSLIAIWIVSLSSAIDQRKNLEISRACGSEQVFALNNKLYQCKPITVEIQK